MAIVIHTGLSLLTVLVVSACATNPGPVTSKPGTTFGKIYVDTPEVYSRERLVNDRFQQDEWLRKKLEEKPTHGIQGSSGSSSRTSTAVSLAVGVKPQTPPEEPVKKSKKPPKEQVEKPGAPQGIEDTPIEQFRDAMAYREEVRNEILENQLDDRHDIAGNTLYRLKFDATVIPNGDTSAYAIVEVTIKGSSFWDINGDDTKVQAPKDGQNTRNRLPVYELARYVTGLNNATISFYDRAYKNWVRDINPPKYSKEEIWFGPLQGYFEFDEKPDQITAKVNCKIYSDETQLEAALNELNARGVPREYLGAGTIISENTYIDEETGHEVLEVTTMQELCVKTGLANFISDLRDHNTVIYTYAVTPKERVQRVYGNTLAAGATGVSIGAEKGAIGASLAHSDVREARANAIMRQPQIVGYSPRAYSPEAHRSGEATMGWLVGPRYKISSDPNGSVSFRHVPTQHTLTGIVSVPSWWGELSLVTKTYWLDENGAEFTQEGQELVSGVGAEEGNEVKITLPADFTSIDTIFDPKRREPKVEPPTRKDEHDELRACETGTVIIRGSQLWRSTVVTLGGQQADSISVLPNMEGIIATINRVQPSISGSEPLYVWTSEGEEFVRTMKISGECENSPAS